MKKNDEILKYLSGMMNDTEKSDFENKMSASADLQNDFAKLNNKLAEICSLKDIKEDSPYFQNLLPRVRQKIEKRAIRKLYPQFAYLLPTAAAVFLILFNTVKYAPSHASVNNINNTQTSAEVNASASDTDLSEVYNEYNPIPENTLTEEQGVDHLSFKVGVSGLINRENIQELIDTHFNIPYLEEFMLASNQGK